MLWARPPAPVNWCHLLDAIYPVPVIISPSSTTVALCHTRVWFQAHDSLFSDLNRFWIRLLVSLVPNSPPVIVNNDNTISLPQKSVMRLKSSLIVRCSLITHAGVWQYKSTLHSLVFKESYWMQSSFLILGVVCKSQTKAGGCQATEEKHVSSPYPSSWKLKWKGLCLLIYLFIQAIYTSAFPTKAQGGL